MTSPAGCARRTHLSMDAVRALRQILALRLRAVVGLPTHAESGSDHLAVVRGCGASPSAVVPRIAAGVFLQQLLFSRALRPGRRVLQRARAPGPTVAVLGAHPGFGRLRRSVPRHVARSRPGTDRSWSPATGGGWRRAAHRAGRAPGPPQGGARAVGAPGPTAADRRRWFPEVCCRIPAGLAHTIRLCSGRVALPAVVRRTSTGGIAWLTTVRHCRAYPLTELTAVCGVCVDRDRVRNTPPRARSLFGLP